MTEQNRAAMALIARRARAYFAPVPAQPLSPAAFASDPPDGWIDLGWVENLKRTSGTHVEALRTGARSAPTAQYHTALDACVECDFAEWGKLQMALSSGGEPRNVLSGGAAAVSAQSSRVQLLMQPGATPFIAGDLVAVDVDYTGQTGAVGSGVATAYVKSAAEVQGDADYIRRVTLNVARVDSVEGDSVSLQQPLPCGIPEGARAQKVIAYVDCEGTAFIPEWSALFVSQSESGGRICWYYPRLQSAAGAQESSVEVALPLESIRLHASFRALPVGGAAALCQRVYFPAANAAAY
jgi:hypothetical protein